METKSGAEFISDVHVRHIMRYVQARDWLTDERIVLDAACGTGYGSRILADDREIIGIDFDKDAIAEARKTIMHNCHFMHRDLLVNDLYKTVPHIDAIVSIETFEHLSPSDGQKLLKQFHHWLPDNGTLIISTPYCIVSGPSPITKQHLWEYSLTDFEQALSLAGFSVQLLKTNRHEGKAGRLGYVMAKATKR